MKKLFYILTVLFFAEISFAKTYYISLSGKDTNAGTLSSPFRSFARGSQALVPGDTLLIRGGTYTERMIHGRNGFKFVNGTPGAYTRYSAYPGEKVIINPLPAQNDPGRYDYSTIYFGKNSYIEVSGLVLDNSRMENIDRYLVKFADDLQGHSISHHIRFTRNELRNAHSGISNGGGNEFIRNSFHNMSGYAMYTLGDNGLIEGNTFHDIGGYAIHHFQSSFSVNNWIIRNNVIFRAGRHYVSPHRNGEVTRHPAVVISRGKGNQFYNNILYNNYEGVSIWGGSSDTLVANNTIYGNDNHGIGNYVKNTRIVNNISFGNKGKNILDAGTNTILQNNLITDPKFVDVVIRNFRLKAGSPAINTGLTLSQVKNDFVYRRRPSGAYDIGAFEY